MGAAQAAGGHTGVGRTGPFLGSEHYQLGPDIVAMGKGIGNGYPVSVAAFSPRVVDRLGPEPIAYAQSHQNDPLGAAVAREVIRIIRDEDLLSRGRRAGEQLVAGLARIAQRSERVAAWRARGLMAAIELREDGTASYATGVQRQLVERGFLLSRRPGTSVLRLDPSLVIAREDLAAFLDTLGELLA